MLAWLSNNFDKGGARPRPMFLSWYTSEIVGVNSRFMCRSCVAKIVSCKVLVVLFFVSARDWAMSWAISSEVSVLSFVGES